MPITPHGSFNYTAGSPDLRKGRLRYPCYGAADKPPASPPSHPWLRCAGTGGTCQIAPCGLPCCCFAFGGVCCVVVVALAVCCLLWLAGCFAGRCSCVCWCCLLRLSGFGFAVLSALLVVVAAASPSRCSPSPSRLGLVAGRRLLCLSARLRLRPAFGWGNDCAENLAEERNKRGVLRAPPRTPQPAPCL